MDHLLDNPIYNALISGNQAFSRGGERAKYFFPDIAPFAGLKENSGADLNKLRAISPPEAFFILFIAGVMDIPAGWKITTEMRILQMVQEAPVETLPAGLELVPLQEEHVPAMLTLTRLTNPGPFLSHTIRFANYRGIFESGQLVAMAGQRLQPRPYIEISAVCTHPDHNGKGYARMLVADQINRTRAASGIPFLHVLRENAGAIRLYEKLGFSTRRELRAYAIKKLPETTGED